jgi:hypothetical protein
MTLIDRNHVIQTLATHRSDQSFTERIRLSEFEVDSLEPKAPSSEQLHPDRLESCMPIMDQKPVGVVARYCFPELLNRPLGRGVFGHTDANYAAGTDLHHD